MEIRRLFPLTYLTGFKMRSHILFAAIFALASGVQVRAPYQEEPCAEVGGTCNYSSSCSGGSTVSGKCPTQGSDVKCCLPCGSGVIQETACSSAGGTCTCNCASGTSVSGKCPTQPASIKCCLPSGGSSMTPSSNCYNLIKRFEGCQLQAYLDPVGIWTIGWGTIRYPDGTAVGPGDTCTQAEADYYLEYEVNQKSKSVDSLIKPATVNQNQFDALTSFTYNVGTGAFGDSTLLKKLKVNPNDPAIRDEFMKWVYGGGVVLPGLVTRRKAEADLYFS